MCRKVENEGASPAGVVAVPLLYVNHHSFASSNRNPSSHEAVHFFVDDRLM